MNTVWKINKGCKESETVNSCHLSAEGNSPGLEFARQLISFFLRGPALQENTQNERSDVVVVSQREAVTVEQIRHDENEAPKCFSIEVFFMNEYLDSM